MELLPDKISELSALATILAIALVTVWRGIPQLIAYLERKDEAHREEIRRMIEDARTERETAHERHVVELGRIHDRLDKIESAVRIAQSGTNNG